MHPRWLPFLLVPAAAVVLLVGGFEGWHYLRVNRANDLAVKYGVASSKGDATLADRCVGVMREAYNTTDDPGKAGVPPNAYAFLAPKVCALGVQRGLVKSDGTMTDQAGRDLAVAVMEQLGPEQVQTRIYNELAVTQYHLAAPGQVTRLDRCMAMGYAGWDAQASKTSLPPRDLFWRAVRQAWKTGIERGLVPESGAPEIGSRAAGEFMQLTWATVRELSSR